VFHEIERRLRALLVWQDNSWTSSNKFDNSLLSIVSFLSKSLSPRYWLRCNIGLKNDFRKWRWMGSRLYYGIRLYLPKNKGLSLSSRRNQNSIKKTIRIIINNLAEFVQILWNRSQLMINAWEDSNHSIRFGVEIRLSDFVMRGKFIFQIGRVWASRAFIWKQLITTPAHSDYSQ